MLKKTSKLTPTAKDCRMSQVYGRTEQFRNMKAAINPQDGIEDLYADDFAETSTYKRALNQALDEQIRSSVLDELHELLLPHYASEREASR